MLRSMYSGISGMKANQTKMDVVGNNVANVGTAAFKKSSTRFADALYQSTIYASAPGGAIGGVNPGQVGIGTKVSGIFKNMVQGAIQPTGRPTDLAIDGDGFFTVQTGPDQFAYTRDGSFSLDMDGYLVTAEGYKVMSPVITGYDKDNNPIYKKDGDKILVKAIEIPKTVEVTAAGGEKETKKVLSFNISKDGRISYLLEDGTKHPKLDDKTGVPENTELDQRLRISVFQNPEGLEQINGNLYSTSANSGDPMDTNAFGQINQGAIEMSNVDLSEEFTEMIVTTRAFQAASKVITTSDELLQEIINLKR